MHATQVNSADSELNLCSPLSLTLPMDAASVDLDTGHALSGLSQSHPLEPKSSADSAFGHWQRAATGGGRIGCRQQRPLAHSRSLKRRREIHAISRVSAILPIERPDAQKLLYCARAFAGYSCFRGLLLPRCRAHEAALLTPSRANT
eukprot:6202136-Pleurochrysis_carterae.AAC.2